MHAHLIGTDAKSVWDLFTFYNAGEEAEEDLDLDLDLHFAEILKGYIVPTCYVAELQSFPDLHVDFSDHSLIFIV